MNLAAKGAGSAIELPSLATFAGSASNVTVGDGGSIALGATTVTMPSAGTGLSIIVPQLPFDVPINLSSTGTFKDTTFIIGGGDTVNIADGSFTGNTMLSVDKQAILDLTGGNLVNYSGTLAVIPATEFGTVRLASGGVVVGSGGLTLDFPPGMFQWTGGEFYASSAAVTNAGSLEIGPGQKLTDTGSLINQGYLTIGAGGQLAVGGDFTQTPGGVLSIGIAGDPASGQFGQLAVKNAAALGGDLAAVLTGSFTPQDNQVFPAMTFASASGDFSNVAALGPALFERLQPTSLDIVASLHDTIDSPLGATLHATEGTTFSGAVASFSDSIPLAQASDFTATIDWGDGTTTTGSVSADNTGGFSISGSHVYAEEGTKTLTISVASVSGGSATIQSQASVGEAGVAAAGAHLTVAQAVSLTNAVVATFTHGDGSEPASDFTAAIDWGNGQTSAGDIVESNGTYSVIGSYSYAKSGVFAVKTTITDDGVSTVIDGSVTVLSLDARHAKYVTAVYEDVLGRAPDAGGLAFWVKQLTAGASISDVAESIAHSDEYYANFVIKPDFVKLLGRAADDGAVTYWTAQMHAGLTDQQLEAELIASDEFYKAAENFDSGPDADDTSIADTDRNADWVEAVYKLLLGRAADAGGEAYWTKQLASGVSRGDVAFSIAEGAENNTQLINADYFHYLGRAADPDGLNYWLEQFAAGKTNEDVIAGFTGSLEYYEKHTN